MTTTPGRCPGSVEGSVSDELGGVVADQLSPSGDHAELGERPVGAWEPLRRLEPDDVIDLRSRVMRRVDRHAGGCWPWTGFISENGYGQFSARIEGRVRGGFAHRWVYELLIGPVPAGLELDHTCCVPGECAGGAGCPHRRCVNPFHLEPVTGGENRLRAALNTAAANWQLRKGRCPQDHPYEGANLRIHRGRRQCVTCVNERNAAWVERAAAGRRAQRRSEALSFFAQIQSYTAVVCPPWTGRGRPPQSRCKRDHPLVDPNLIHRPDGTRACRACRLLRRMAPDLRAEVESLGRAS